MAMTFTEGWARMQREGCMQPEVCWSSSVTMPKPNCEIRSDNRSLEAEGQTQNTELDMICFSARQHPEMEVKSLFTSKAWGCFLRVFLDPLSWYVTANCLNKILLFSYMKWNMMNQIRCTVTIWDDLNPCKKLRTDKSWKKRPLIG